MTTERRAPAANDDDSHDKAGAVDITNDHGGYKSGGLIKSAGRGIRKFAPLYPFVLLALAIRLFAVTSWFPTCPEAKHFGERIDTQGCVTAGWGDAFYFTTQARLMANGNPFANPTTWFQHHFHSDVPEFLPGAGHPPAYPVTLALLDTLGYDEPAQQRLVFPFVGALGVLLIGMAAWKVACGRAGPKRPDQRGPRLVGMVAAGIAATYPMLWINDFRFLSESIYIPMVALLLMAAYRFWRSPTFASAAWFGAALGVVGLTRGEGFFILAWTLPFLVWGMRQFTWGRRVALGATTVGVMMAFIGPWVLYNYSRFDKPVFLTSGTGIVMIHGSCDDAFYGEAIGYYSFNCAKALPSYQQDRFIYEEDEADTVARGLAQDYVKERMAQVPVVVAARVGRVWDLYAPFQNIDYNDQLEGRGWWTSASGLFYYWALLPFAVAGCVMLRRRRMALSPMLGVVVAVTVTAAASFGVTRYRVPAEVPLVILASVGIVALLHRVTPRCAHPLDTGMVGGDDRDQDDFGGRGGSRRGRRSRHRRRDPDRVTRDSALTGRRAGAARGLVATAVLATVAMAGVLVGCDRGPGEAGIPASNILPTKPGGTLRYSLVWEPAGLDPTKVTFDAPTIQVARAIYDTLLVFDENSDPRPGLAREVTWNTDFTEFVLTLRDGVKFSDGSAFDSGAVKANLDAARSGPVLAEVLRPIAGVEVDGPGRVKVKMKFPWAVFPTLLAGQAGSMAAPATLSDPDGAHRPVGTGPFAVDSWDRGRQLVVKKRPDYWQKDLPSLETVEFWFTPDAAARMDAVRAGVVDIAQFVEPTELARLASEGKRSNLQNLNDPSDDTTELVLALNAGKPPFDDLGARGAVGSAIDKEAVSSVFEGQYQPADGPFTEGSRFFGNAPWTILDTAHAHQLTTEYKASHGTPLRFRLAVGPSKSDARLARLLQSQFAEVGIPVDVDIAASREALNDAVAAGEFDAAVVPMFGAAHPDEDYAALYGGDLPPIGTRSSNFSRFRDEKLDMALDAARRTDDVTKQAEQYQVVQDALAREMPYLFLVHVQGTIVARPQVRGLTAWRTPDGQAGVRQYHLSVALQQAWLDPNVTTIEESDAEVDGAGHAGG